MRQVPSEMRTSSVNLGSPRRVDPSQSEESPPALWQRAHACGGSYSERGSVQRGGDCVCTAIPKRATILAAGRMRAPPAEALSGRYRHAAGDGRSQKGSKPPEMAARAQRGSTRPK
jgi:hypothetical protein